MNETILTLNPDPGKKGVNIDKAKYDFIHAEIVKVLREIGPIGAMQLVKELDRKVGDEKFGASVGWYTTAVRLDMEARHEILYNRDGKKPLITLPLDKDIYKAGGIILRGRKVLAERSVGKAYFIHPGGKLEPGESMKRALVRELKEELLIDVNEEDLEFFDRNSAPAANSPEVDVHMEVFMVNKWDGEITPAAEVEDIRWLTSKVPEDIKIGSIMEHETLPKLKAAGLID